MKRFLVLAVAMTFVVTACGGDDPLTPGAIDDPIYEIFSEEYDVVDDDTILMSEMIFNSIEGVFAQAGGVHSVAGEFGLSLVWDEETSSWIGTFNFTNDRGASVSATSTLQFFHGTDAVQFPDENLLTEIRSSVTMNASDLEGNTFAGSQDLVITPAAGDNIVIINGSGEYTAAYAGTHEHEGGTTTCAVDASFTTSISDLRIDDSELAVCNPVGGRLTHSGNFYAECTGAQTVTVDRHWTVSVSWDEAGTGTIRFVSGGNVWEVVEPCEGPAS